MLIKLRKNLWRIMLCLLFVIALACIRGFEEHLFYDPFSVYFENEYLNLPFPEFDFSRLIGSMSFRYLLNMAVSLAIIQMLFGDQHLTRFSALLYLILYVLLMAAFIAVVTLFSHEENFILFYIRRFLIQPLFLLLFVPAFYYQSRITKK